jgi:hypothetical protein
MEIRPSGSAASRRAPADYFTGAVWQDPIVEAPAPGNVRASVVRFEPGARTAWHTHPAGQTLYILSGVGHPAGGVADRQGEVTMDQAHGMPNTRLAFFDISPSAATIASRASFARARTPPSPFCRPHDRPLNKQ